MFKNILKLSVAAAALYYAYHGYNYYFGSSAPEKSAFNKKFDAQIARGEYDVLPPPTAPAPDRIVFADKKNHIEEIRAMMAKNKLPGTRAPIVVFPKPLKEMSPEERKEWGSYVITEAKKQGITFATITRMDLYEGMRQTEFEKNCFEEPPKGGYGWRVTCCEGAKKDMIRAVAYYEHMTIADATKKVNARIDDNGCYPTDIWVFDRHYADCQNRDPNPQYLYVEQNIPDSLAYVSKNITLVQNIPTPVKTNSGE